MRASAIGTYSPSIQAQPSFMRGRLHELRRDLADAVDDRGRERQRVVAGRVVRVGRGDDRHAGRVRRAQAVGRVLDRHAGPRVDVESPRGLQVDVGRGLAARDLLGGDGRPEEVRRRPSAPGTRR